jgi:hypothetical protein
MNLLQVVVNSEWKKVKINLVKTERIKIFESNFWPLFS